MNSNEQMTILTAKANMELLLFIANEYYEQGYICGIKGEITEEMILDRVKDFCKQRGK